MSITLQQLEKELEAIAKLNDETQYNKALKAHVEKLEEYSEENTDSTFDIKSIESTPFESRAILKNSKYDEMYSVTDTESTGDETSVVTDTPSESTKKDYLLTVFKYNDDKNSLKDDVVVAANVSKDIMSLALNGKNNLELKNISQAAEDLNNNYVENLVVGDGTMKGGKRSKRKSSKRKSSKRKSSKRGRKGKRSTKHRR
jgi:hypothetical protein